MHYSHDDDFLTSLLPIWIDLTYVTHALKKQSVPSLHVILLSADYTIVTHLFTWASKTFILLTSHGAEHYYFFIILLLTFKSPCYICHLLQVYKSVTSLQSLSRTMLVTSNAELRTNFKTGLEI